MQYAGIVSLHWSGNIRSDEHTNVVSDTPAEPRERTRSQQETRKGYSQAGHFAFQAQPHQYVTPDVVCDMVLLSSR